MLFCKGQENEDIMSIRHAASDSLSAKTGSAFDE